MLFNSYGFIFLFLPIVLLGALLLKDGKGSKLWLLGASLFFYGYWSWWSLLLVIGSVITNYIIARKIYGEKVRTKLFLSVGIVFNVSIIFIFKYLCLIYSSLASLLEDDWKVLDIVLPLAISFYTFQQIGFLVELYRQKVKLPSFYDYCLFVMFFPQLVAGPIVNFKQFGPQLELRTPLEKGARAAIEFGLFLFAIGLCKKVLVADQLSIVVTSGFAFGWSNGNWLDWGCILLCYGAQIYFDFSGYSDMAVGLALVFGYRLPFNFNSPYRAVSVSEFWRRWHISLSSFFREYLYFPMGGSRVGEWRVLFNLFIVMLICGLWHGANWSFVFWGGLHGIALCVGRVWSRLGLFRIHTGFSWALTFIFVLLAWFPFRSESISDSLGFYARFFDQGFWLNGSSFVGESLDLYSLLILCLAYILILFGRNTSKLSVDVQKYPALLLFALGVMSALAFLKIGGPSEFIYFNF